MTLMTQAMRCSACGNDAHCGAAEGKVRAGGTSTTASVMSRGGEPYEHERAGLAVLKRSVALVDDHRSTASDWS
jgi:hypothetical protein